MKTLKALLEEVRVFNLDTDDELDLDALAELDLDSLLGGEYSDEQQGDGLDFSSDDDLGEFDLNGDLADPSMDIEGLGADAIADADGAGGLEGEGGTDFEFDVGDITLDDYEADEDFDDMSQEDADDIATGGEEGHPDFQGEIRTVRGANLVFKRKTDDGNFEELWIYNVGNDIKRETQIRRAILAGTDVDPGSQQSKDGQQRADSSTTGNVQFLHIVGLPQ